MGGGTRPVKPRTRVSGKGFMTQAHTDAGTTAARIRSNCRRCSRSWAAYSRRMCSRLSSPRSACSPTRARSSGVRRSQRRTFARGALRTARAPRARRRRRSRAGPPQILIVAGNRRPIVRQYHPQPEAADEIGVCQVLNHLTNRPFSGCLGASRNFWRHRFEEAPESARGLAEHGDGILVAEQLEEGGNIAVRAGRGRRSGVAEDAHR